MRTQCHNCKAEIETTFGADSPSEHEGADGTADDPRAPGDFDNVCDVCNYRDGIRGYPRAAFT